MGSKSNHLAQSTVVSIDTVINQPNDKNGVTGAVHVSGGGGHFRMQTRHVVLFLCMMVNLLSYTMRTNINIAIVSMVKPEQGKNETDTCLAADSVANVSSTYISWIPMHHQQQQSPHSLVTIDYEETSSGDFDWSESLQGTIVGAFYYGYIVTQNFGGQLADLVGAKRLVVLSVFISSIATLLIPVSAYYSPYMVVGMRVLTGIAQGVVTPTIYTMLPLWTPRNELGLAFGLILASGNLGAVLTMPLSSLLCESNFAGGWPSVFYVFGTVGLLFIPFWLYFVYNTPKVHPRIRPEEQQYIASNLQSNNGDPKRKAMVPWLSILCSLKIWGIAVSRFCSAWGNLFLMSKLPSYLRSILHMPITYNGYVNASIFITTGASQLIWGYVSDYVEKKQWFARTLSRKLFQSLALFGGAAFLAVIPAAGCNALVIVILLNLSMVTLGLIAGGESLIVVDVAPDYAGSIYGFTNAVASLPGFLAPLFVGVMLDQPDTNPMTQWNILFWVGSAIYAIGAVVFIVFTNSNPEKWGYAPSEQLQQRSSMHLEHIDKSKFDSEKANGTAAGHTNLEKKNSLNGSCFYITSSHSNSFSNGENKK